MLTLVPAGPEVGLKLNTTSGVVWAADGPAVPTSCITIAAAANAVHTLRFLIHLSLSSQGPLERRSPDRTGDRGDCRAAFGRHNHSRPTSSDARMPCAVDVGP